MKRAGFSLKSLFKNPGLFAVLSAFSLVFTFLVTACRKKSLLQALLVFAVAESASGAICALAGREAVCENAGGSDSKAEEARLAEEKIHAIFHAPAREITAADFRREVPRDEDASEADFQ